MKNKRKRFFFILTLAGLTALTGEAFQPIPKESAKALRVTRSKPFSAGAVFVNGKYIEPPYVVERWGTGIRINSVPVTGQIVDWNDFLKTQDGVRIEKKTEEAAMPASLTPPPQPVAAPSAADDASSLDDLFDDDPKPTKAPSAPAASFRPAVTKSARTSVTYVLSGDFKLNEEAKTLLKRINKARTDIDRSLRAGGFICFGDAYSMVQGDRRTLLELLERLPELQQRSPDVHSFCSGLRDAKLVYLNEVLSWELFRNRSDYRKLKDLRERLKADQKWNQILEEVSNPLF